MLDAPRDITLYALVRIIYRGWSLIPQDQWVFRCVTIYTDKKKPAEAGSRDWQHYQSNRSSSPTITICAVCQIAGIIPISI